MGLKRYSATPNVNGSSASPSSLGDWGRSWPGLCEFLSMSAWPDGKSRATGTMLVFVADGRWKMFLNDKDAGVQCCITANSPDQLMTRAEEEVESRQGDWRADKRRGK